MKKFSIKINGHQYEAEVEEILADSAATQHVHEMEVQAPAQQGAPVPMPAAQKKNAVPAGATTITAPMPGSVIQVNVNEGDRVKKDQILLILEAMKMENEIAAPSDGVVASINVSKGDSVNSGDVLISLT